MENNEELVTDVTENVDEQATEELVDGASVDTGEQQPEQNTKPPRTYTDEQVDDIVKRRLARQENKLRKEYDKKYGRLENVLKVGTGEQELDKIAEGFETYYESKGKKIPQEPQYSQDYIEYQAEKEAKLIIDAGYDEIKEETDRLSKMNLSDMTAEEKIVFSRLAAERSRIEDERELASIGVTKLDDDFKDFAKKLNPSLSMKEKYEMYTKMNPKKKGEPIGSMKNTTVSNTGVKDYYSPEEVDKFTKADYDKNPALYKAVCDSMTKWRK